MNYEGKSSKAMEADGTLRMALAIYLRYKGEVYISEFVSDDDASTRKILKSKVRQAVNKLGPKVFKNFDKLKLGREVGLSGAYKNFTEFSEPLTVGLLVRTNLLTKIVLWTFFLVIISVSVLTFRPCVTRICGSSTCPSRAPVVRTMLTHSANSKFCGSGLTNSNGNFTFSATTRTP